MPPARLEIAPYARQHRRLLLDLMNRSCWTHTHIDWQSIPEWLADSGAAVWLALQDGELQGCLGLSRAVAGWRWLRLLGMGEGYRLGVILRELWARAEAACRDEAGAGIAVLALTNWQPAYLAELGFQYCDDLVVLQHIGSRLPQQPDSLARARPVEAADMAELAQLDKLAFAPPWQIERAELWRAYRACAVATVATIDSRIVGYQLCARHGEAAHLARLAVHPAHQGRGVASLLLQGLLSDLLGRGITAISVNTQASNRRSQQLYQRYGFLRNGKHYAVWQKTLVPATVDA
ncbi:MAG: GNAT family N-acetyltransferase [Chloroflexi bacterium]|nr:GNAT family N-acetyltransferase [Chloroflexota bacterium]MCY4246741.1 GNAT family N-acetyltransferase [Chloroflexota bacterium]